MTCTVFACNRTSHWSARDLRLLISTQWMPQNQKLTCRTIKIKFWTLSRDLYKKPFWLTNLRRRLREDSLKLFTWDERNTCEPGNVSDYASQKNRANKYNAWNPKIICKLCCLLCCLLAAKLIEASTFCVKQH